MTRISLPLLAICFHLIAFSQDFSLNAIPDSLSSNASAVVRLDHMHVDVIHQRLMKVYARRVVTVLEEQGDGQAHAYQFYDKETDIKTLSATVYNAQGVEINRFKEKEFQDQSATGGGTMYSDNRIKFLRYTPISYPYTIEVIKEYETSDTGFLPSWNFMDGYEVSTQESEFVISFPPELKYRIKEHRLDEFGVSVNREPNKLVYKANNLIAMEQEPYAPKFRNVSPWVSCALEKFHLKGVDGSAESWADFGHWVNDQLLMGQDELDELTKQKVRALVEGVSDQREIIKRIYNYVQDNTRYISVQLGIGGWQPISADEVDRVKYGDCKGLTNYTKALLKEVGMESYYTIIYGSDDFRDIDPDFVAMQGNHAVLNVPTETGDIWLECTSQDTPVDYSAMFTDNRYALRIKPEGGEIVKTKNYPDQDNYQYTNAIITLNSDNGISAEVKIESTGTQYGQKYDLPSLTSDEQLDFYYEYWSYVNNMKVASVEHNNDKDHVLFTENLKVSTFDYISTAGNNLLFAPNMFNRNLFVPARVRNRKFDLVISRGYLDEDEFIIQLPENIKVESLLQPVTIQTEFGEYSVTTQKISDDQIKFQRRLLIKSGTFDKTKYKAYRDFKRKIAQNDNAKIVLTKI